MANLGPFIEKIEHFLNDIASLEITTVVGDFRVVYNKETGKWEPADTGSPLEAMQTRINLFQGDLTSAMHQNFSTGGDSVVRDFHDSQVQKAQGIVDSNVKAFKEIIGLLTDARNEHKITDEIVAARAAELQRARQAAREARAKADADPADPTLRSAAEEAEARTAELESRLRE